MVTPKIYWEEWDIPQTQAMICVAGFSKEIEDWIWTKERKPFEIF